MSAYSIESILAHRFPMLMIDEIQSIEPMLSCRAFKTLRADEWFFSGHFPGHPVMPGSLQIEAFTQAVALPLLIGKDSRQQEEFPLILFAVDKARFYRQLLPSEKLEIIVQIDRLSMGMASASAIGLVGTDKVSECKIAYSLKGFSK
jgi:3-hydroxymyristoyl/3-hydroxydecanoyl-(acyl carrier protein) dehydratase